MQMCLVVQDGVLNREDAQCADVPSGAGWSELCALVNKPSGASAGASDLKY